MKSLRNHLQEELQDSEFREAFEEELHLARLAVQISKIREKKGLTQEQLATRAHITQQQVSKVEHAGASGFNVNTLLRVCDALGVNISFSPRKAPTDKVVGKKYATTSFKGSRKKAPSKKTSSNIFQSTKSTGKRSVFA